MDLPLNDKQRLKLYGFIHAHFNKLPEKTKALFKNAPLFPGKGVVGDYGEWDSLLMIAKSSAKKVYLYHKYHKTDLCQDIGNQIVIQALLAIQSIVISHVEKTTTPIIGNLINVLRISNIEQNANLIVSLNVANNIRSAKNFVAVETKQNEEGIIYKIGKWKNVRIYVNPSMNEDDNTAHLLFGNVIDYRLVDVDGPAIDIEDGVYDMNVTFNPTMLQYKLSSEDNYKFFKIKKLLYE